MDHDDSGIDPDVLVATRRDLHTVAERVLATYLHANNGHIGLRPTPGGVRTPWFTADRGEQRARTDGAQIVVEDRVDARRAPMTTLGDTASFVGVPPTGPVGVYNLVTPLEPDAPLRIDQASALLIADWFMLGGVALDRLAAAHADLEPSTAQLWPEHFDLAISMAEVNYGASPGDDAHASPYLYVGPWARKPGTYWNEPFGASVTMAEIPDVAAAVAFFEQGRAAAAP